jgi:hypothetical protein
VRLAAPYFDGFQVPHEARQVLEMAPKVVKLFGGTLNGHGRFHFDALTGWQGGRPALGFGGAHTEGAVNGATAIHAAIDKRTAGNRHTNSGPGAAAQAKGSQCAARQHGGPAFNYAQVHRSPSPP